MREVAGVPLDAAAFAPFGETLLAGAAVAVPLNGRVGARSVLETVVAPPPTAPGRHVLTLMERHPHSTQAFFSLGGDPYLVVVAPDAGGRPDLDGLRAFVAPSDAVIQYRTAVWHAPMTTLGASGRFAYHVHKDGTDADCTFVDIPPVAIRLDLQPTPDAMETTADAYE